MKKLLLILGLAFSFQATAAIQCGGYRLTLNDDEGMLRINGEKVHTQKVKYLDKPGDDANAKWDMTIMPASDGRMYGFEFIKQNGKAFLNVELIRRDMDAPRLIGSFDCKKIPD